MNRINENYPGNPLDSRRSNQVIIEEPVLLITGAGNPTYGHWILDFLPRLVIALRLLSLVSDAIPILLPSGTPGWVGRMLRAYCGIDPDRIRIYSEQDDNVLCRHLCLPSFGHNGTYSLHKIVREFYTSLGNASRIEKQRRICLSRSSFSQGRVFTARDSLERIASSRGYEIVRPEELSFSEQADMYHSATCIVGEAGSGLHGSVFSKPGTIVASIGFNWIQAHVSGAFEQRLVSLDRLQSVQSARDEVQAFTARDNDLVGLFDQIDRLQKESSSYSTAR